MKRSNRDAPSATCVATNSSAADLVESDEIHVAIDLVRSYVPCDGFARTGERRRGILPRTRHNDNVGQLHGAVARHSVWNRRQPVPVVGIEYRQDDRRPTRHFGAHGETITERAERDAATSGGVVLLKCAGTSPLTEASAPAGESESAAVEPKPANTVDNTRALQPAKTPGLSIECDSFGLRFNDSRRCAISTKPRGHPRFTALGAP